MARLQNANGVVLRVEQSAGWFSAIPRPFGVAGMTIVLRSPWITEIWRVRQIPVEPARSAAAQIHHRGEGSLQIAASVEQRVTTTIAIPRRRAAVGQRLGPVLPAVLVFRPGK